MFPLFVSVSLHLMVHLYMNELHFDDFLACKFNVSVIFNCTFLTILFYVFTYWTLIFTLPTVNLIIMIQGIQCLLLISLGKLNFKCPSSFKFCFQTVASISSSLTPVIISTFCNVCAFCINRLQLTCGRTERYIYTDFSFMFGIPALLLVSR